MSPFSYGVLLLTMVDTSAFASSHLTSLLVLFYALSELLPVLNPYCGELDDPRWVRAYAVRAVRSGLADLDVVASSAAAGR